MVWQSHKPHKSYGKMKKLSDYYLNIYLYILCTLKQEADNFFVLPLFIWDFRCLWISDVG